MGDTRVQIKVNLDRIPMTVSVQGNQVSSQCTPRLIYALTFLLSLYGTRFAQCTRVESRHYQIWPGRGLQGVLALQIMVAATLTTRLRYVLSYRAWARILNYLNL